MEIIDHGPYGNICLAIRYLNHGENRDFGRSRQLVRRLKANNELNTFFDERGVSKGFETLLREFINIMEKGKAAKYKYYRKYWLYNYNNFTKCAIKYNYEFGAYFLDKNEITKEDERNFNSFPWLFKHACMYYDIEPYASMDEEELRIYLNDYVDLSNKRIIHPNMNKSYKREGQSAERYVYRQFNKNKTWLVAENGDGYGYDILHISKKDNLETLIEVKNSESVFRLSRLERKVMYESADLENTEYLIYNFEKGNLSIYKYDKERNILVDINNENHICTIEAYMDYERENRQPKQPRIRFLCTPMYLEEKKILKLK